MKICVLLLLLCCGATAEPELADDSGYAGGSFHLEVEAHYHDAGERPESMDHEHPPASIHHLARALLLLLSYSI